MPTRPPLNDETPNGSKHDSGYFSPLERFARDENSDWTSAFTLLDTMETYFDSRIDLLQRRLKTQSERLKSQSERLKQRAADQTFKIRDLSGDLLTENFDREVKNFKLKVSSRLTSLSASWQSAKVVRTREKVSFFFGVMSLLVSALLFGMAPQYVHIAYTIQGVYLLPMRAYIYKKRAWHYFLFDLCYYVTILNFVFIWIAPQSTYLWIACYCLSHGSLASAVITWRNSLVFHDSDKVTSLFVHIYAPFTFTVIRHYYPGSEARFPAVGKLEHMEPVKAILFSGVIYAIWQSLYWKFVLIDRRAKIASGQRTTSFSFLLNDKRGVIGRQLSAIPERFREAAFMAGQLVYAITTELPAIFLLYSGPRWSGSFLIAIFSVSVWNGGGFYIEVFGRKFERELEAMRKELAEATAARSGRSSPSPDTISRTTSDDDLSSLSSISSPPTTVSAVLSPDELAEVPDMTLKKDQ